jgi:hypothetical protein
VEIPYELVIDEPIKGHFYWVISMGEAPGRARSVVDFPDRHFKLPHL